MYTQNTELRKMYPVEIEKLARCIGENNWKKLISIIKNEDIKGEMLFTTDHVKTIENTSRLIKKSESEIFLEEWSTIGKKRPTIGILLEYLIKLELFRAADYLAMDILKTNRPKRPRCGPAADIKIDDNILELVGINNLLRGLHTRRESEPAMVSLNNQGSTAFVESVNKPHQSNSTISDISASSDLINFSSLNLVDFPKNLQNPNHTIPMNKKNINEKLSKPTNDQNDVNVKIELSKSTDDQNDENKNSEYVLSMAETRDIPFFVMNNCQESSKDDDVKDNKDTSKSNSAMSKNSELVCTTDSSYPKLSSSKIKGFECEGSLSDIFIPVCVLEMCADKLKDEDKN